jgi:predicted transcriptional regulator
MSLLSSMLTDECNMKQRGTFSIMTLVLLALQQKPLTKTRLMQQVMLSYNRIGYYCDLLMRQGLIEYGSTNHTYVITPKGSELLRLAEELAGYLDPLDQMIKKYSCYILGSPDYYPLHHQEYGNSIDSDKPPMAINHTFNSKY